MRRWIKIICGNIVALFVLLVLIEGVTSSFLFVYDLITTVPSAERRHTRYDPELGWVNLPNVHVADMYGAGVYLRTNSQGFRNNEDFAAVAAGGKIRIICAGDSFTLGYGVDNDHTWCQRLTSLDTRLETVNMGQGGYGADQMYLWLRRDSGKLRHTVSLFAFTTLDFQRMQSNRFVGYGKPVLELEDGKLLVKNVPVPTAPYGFTWLLSRRDHFSKLRTSELVTRLLLRERSSDGDRADRRLQDRNEKTRNILARVFEELKDLEEKHSSRLILVYLPHPSELQGNGPEEWIKFVESVSGRLQIPLINVLRDFQSMPHEQAGALFIPKGKLKYPGSAGHFNDQGNEVVAGMIYKELKQYLTPAQ